MLSIESIFLDPSHSFISFVYPYSVLANYSTFPILYFYILISLRPNFKLTWRHLIHFLPAIFFFINSTPFFFESENQKYLTIEASMHDISRLSQVNTFFVPINVQISMRLFLALFYLLGSLRIIRKVYQAKIHEKSKGLLNRIHWNFTLIGLLTFYILTILYLGSAYQVDLFFHLESVLDKKFLFYFSRFSNLIVTISILFFPKILFEKLFPYMNSHPEINENNESKSNESVILNFDLTIYDEKMNDYLGDSPWLEPGFSLTIIANELEIPHHRISQYFSARFKQNFNDYKNQKRIEYAKSLIDNGKLKSYTMEHISASAGFRSRTNFNDAFKKVYQMTPSEYLESRK